MSSIFFPLIDNGQGDIKANFLICATNAFRSREVQMERYSDSLVPRARNRAAAGFLRGKCDYLLFIDSDIVFSKDNIDCLMESDEPILAGIYCKKENEVAPCWNLLDDMPAGSPTGGLVEIKRAGTGFLRIARVVLERMKENPHAPHWTQAPLYKNHGQDEWDFFPTGVKDHEYLSEDWYFCDRARALGYKIMCDTRIQTKHEGTTFYPTDEAVARQKQREQDMSKESRNAGNSENSFPGPEGSCVPQTSPSVPVVMSSEVETSQNSFRDPSTTVGMTEVAVGTTKNAVMDPLGLVTPANN